MQMIPAEQIATDLLTIGAVTLAPNHPFLWASGMQAPNLYG